MEDQTAERRVFCVRHGRGKEENTVVVREESLEIYVEGEPYAVVMRTPGDEIALAAGFLLSAGVITARADLGAVEHCGDSEAGRVLVRLSDKGQARGSDLLQRRTSLSWSGCGPSGKETLAEISERIPECTRAGAIAPPKLFEYLETFTSQQVVRAASRGAHAVALFDAGGAMISFAEDVGRHNAMDKVIGRLLMADRLAEAVVCVASSRASFEMVQKAAAAGIPILATVSVPTSLAIELAEKTKMTLIRLMRDGEINVYAGIGRIRLPQSTG